MPPTPPVQPVEAAAAGVRPLIASRMLAPSLAATIAEAAARRARELVAEKPIAPGTVDLLRSAVGPVKVHGHATQVNPGRPATTSRRDDVIAGVRNQPAA